MSKMHELSLKRNAKTESDFGFRLMEWFNPAIVSTFVYDVTVDSPADRSGMTTGDRIVSVDGMLVRCADEVRALLDGKSEIRIVIERTQTGDSSQPQMFRRSRSEEQEASPTVDCQSEVSGTVLGRFPESHWLLKMLGRASYQDQIGRNHLAEALSFCKCDNVCSGLIMLNQMAACIRRQLFATRLISHIKVIDSSTFAKHSRMVIMALCPLFSRRILQNSKKLAVVHIQLRSKLTTRIFLFFILNNVASVISSSLPFSVSTESTDLKEVMASKIVEHSKKVASFRKEHSKSVIGEITIDMVYGGMRSMKALLWETSLLDPELGIKFRGRSIPEVLKQLPTLGSNEPLPEGIFWLLCTGDVPTAKQVQALRTQFNQRAVLPEHVVQMVLSFPKQLHPMAQFISAIAALSSESKFSAAYTGGIPKSTFWEYIYEDALNLIAKLTPLAAMIYRSCFKSSSTVCPIDPEKDWAANFAAMLGYEDKMFVELLRLYLIIHCDHEGGNVSAHTCHLVGSALSDPYLAFSASMAGLAGPLHGLANQEVLLFLHRIMEEIGKNYTKEALKQWVNKRLDSGLVIPGYGHAVLRKTDPRFLCQKQFAERFIKNDALIQLVWDLYEIVPGILEALGKVKNPYPNVDAHSGVLLQHYGMKEMNFYTVLFGVSRALGVMAQLIWSRALGLPLERPKSMTTDNLMSLVGK
ncbi:citrate (Si)-synthase, eukaryotic [Trichuris suis]|nr:citrate (Si)-synthase, eukaryotic [Trichuris suis]